MFYPSHSRINRAMPFKFTPRASTTHTSHIASYLSSSSCLSKYNINPPGILKAFEPTHTSHTNNLNT